MDTERSLRKFLLPALAVAVIAVLLLALWRQQSEIARLQNAHQMLLAPDEKAQQDAPKIPELGEGEAPVSSVVRAQTSDTRSGQELRQGESQSQEPNNLTLSDTTVQPITGGLTATMRFRPSGTGALGELALVIRLPKEGDGRILDLVPTDSVKYSGVAKRVSEDGKFAIFQGTPEAINDLQFGLSVSEPATADVRGTCGIEPFQLDIGSTGATTRRN